MKALFVSVSFPGLSSLILSLVAMEQQSRWKRWFRRRRAAPPPEEAGLAALRKAYLGQQRRWDYAVTFCALLTLITVVLRPLSGVALLPFVATLFAISQYRKCNRFAQTVREMEALQRWVEKLQAEAKQEEEQRQEEARRRE